MPEPEVTPQPVVEPTPEPLEPKVEPEAPKVVSSWHDSFTDDTLKTDEGIKKYKSLDDFGKAFKEKDSMIGRKGVILPTEGDQVDMDRFLNELGRPDASDKYVVPEIQVEDEFKQFVSEDKLNAFKGIAHKYGLTQAQFEGLTKEYTATQLDDIKNIVHENNKALEDSTKTLMNDWLRDYDANAKQAELALKSYAKDVDPNKVAALLRDPDVKRMFYNVAQSVSEDTFRKGESASHDTIQTLQGFIDSQVKTTGSSYHNNMAPDHKATKEKVRAAYERIEALTKDGAA